MLTRDKIALTMRDDRSHFKSMKGRLFITSMRMVFLPGPSSTTHALQSIEMPLRGVWDERFHQPVFGVNNLTASVQYYDGEPFVGELTIKLEFREGGVNTFLPVFNNVLRAIRAQLIREEGENQRQGQQEAGLNAAGATGATGANVYGASVPVYQAQPIPAPTSAASSVDYLPGKNDAFVDPKDPSRIYTTQPAVEGNARRENLPSWSASAAGLRKRR